MAFKAKLIEDPIYYSLKRKELFIGLITAIPAALLANYFERPIWIVLVAFFVYIFLLLILKNNKQEINDISGQKIIEIEADLITLKSVHNKIIDSFDLTKSEKISLNKDFGMPQESIADIAQEMKGKPKQNFIIIEQNGEIQKFDFLVDSYYMIKQLDKIIEQWQQKGIEVVWV
jgi:Ca2+/Na+ antiporter